VQVCCRSFYRPECDKKWVIVGNARHGLKAGLRPMGVDKVKLQLQVGQQRHLRLKKVVLRITQSSLTSSCDRKV